MAGSGQLDLWGGGAPSAGAVRWVDTAQPGRLGFGPIDTDLSKLRAEHRVSVVVAVTEDPAPLVEAAAGEDIDVRHLAPRDGELDLGPLGRHAAALAADARAGRRVAVLGAGDAALLVAAALVELGRSLDEATHAVGGPEVLGAARETLEQLFAR